MTRMQITHTITYEVEVEDYITAAIKEDELAPDEITLPDDLDVIAHDIPLTEEEALINRWARHCVKITDDVIVWHTTEGES
jgi:hypothetical protein